MRSVAVENVLQVPYEAISEPHVHDAVAAFSAAKAEREQRRKDVTELEQTREAAEWRDAEAAEQARADGKAEPKRTHVAEHDRKTDAARHEQRIAVLAEQRARDALDAAITEHADAWAAEAEGDVQAMTAEWQNTVEGLIALHGRLTGAVRVARVVGIKVPQVGALEFERRAIEGIELASPHPPGPAILQTATVLAALASAVEVEPDVEKEPVTHPPLARSNSAAAGMGAVQDEIRERREFTERVAPDVERRRQRNAALRQEREAAVAEQAVAG